MKNLALARLPLQPQQFFADLSTECVNYQIHSQDVYNDYDKTAATSTLLYFEQEVADYLGKESGLFVPSGVMTQNIVLALAKEKKSCQNFLCHWSSHLLIHEYDSYHHLLGLHAVVVPPNLESVIQAPLMFTDMMQTLTKSSLDVNHPALAAIFIELPHREVGGKITPWEDLQKISEFCRTHNIHLHMDGARLWEAAAAYPEHSLKEIAALFDSIYVSFYKGIGAITGAMLLGTTQYLNDAKPWLRRFGGNLYSHLPYYVSCLSSFHQNKDTFHYRKEQFVEIVRYLTLHLLSKPLNFIIVEGKQEPIIFFDPPLPLVSLVHVYVRGQVSDVLSASETAAHKSGISCFVRMRPGRFAAKEYSYTEINLVSDLILLVITLN